MVLAGISLRGGISCNMASCWADATRSLIYYAQACYYSLVKKFITILFTRSGYKLQLQ
jgi:hypothetical protein